MLNQKKAEGQRIEINTVVNAVMEVYGWIFDKDSQEYADLTKAVTANLNELLTTNGANLQKIADDFAKQSSLNALQPLGLNDNKYFLLIAHSQGNLYANELINKYKTTLGENHFSLLSIATPASVVEGYQWYYNGLNNAYVTSASDKVIRLVPNSLPANAYQSTFSDKDPENHSLVNTYLSDPMLLQKIQNLYSNFVQITLNKNIYFAVPAYTYAKLTTGKYYTRLSGNPEDYAYTSKSFDNYPTSYRVYLEENTPYTIINTITIGTGYSQDLITIPSNYTIDKTDYNYCMEVDRTGENMKCTRVAQASEPGYISDILPPMYSAGSDMCRSNNKMQSSLQREGWTFPEILVACGAVQNGGDIISNEFTIKKR